MLNTNISSPEFKTLANFLYPKRSYIVVDDPNYDPNTTFGGKWEKLAEGYTLWTTTYGGGGTNPEGLPNIEGQLKKIMYANDGEDGASGPFSRVSVNTWYGPNTGSSNRRSVVNFNAHDYNPIYGASDHVVPKGYKVIIWRRTELWGVN